MSLTTIATAEREGYLWRLLKQAPWVRAYEWVIAGPADLENFCRTAGAIHVPCDVSHGVGRNLAAERATGEILIHLDDDDWQAPDRVEKQVFALSRPMPGNDRVPHPEVVGSSWLYSLDTTRGGGIASRNCLWDVPGAIGAVLAYYRSSWEACPFYDGGGEDGPFCDFFNGRGSFFDMHDPKLIVHMRSTHTQIHGDWWYETRNQEKKKSALEVMRERIMHPGRQLGRLMHYGETPRDLALLHEEEAATVYVKHLMGADFATFVQPVASVVRPHLATR